MELNGRQKKFLKAAYKIAPREEDRFFIEAVAYSIRLPEDEGLDIFQILRGRPYELVDWAHDFTKDSYGGSVKVTNPNGSYAKLSQLGREVVRQLRDDKRAERKAKVWAFAKGGWAAVLTVVVAVAIPLLNQKIERLQQRTKAATQPTTRP